MTVDQVLFGYYVIPDCAGAPLQVVVNPEGNEFRSQARCNASSPHLLASMHPSNEAACMPRD